MLRVGSWLYGKKPGQSVDSHVELKDLHDAMTAATLILNDDVDGAENGLSTGTSSFHNLGKGVVAFVRATLGFEQEIMRQASERLYEAETSAANDQTRSQQNAQAPNTFHSDIYAPGTEYALCQAIAQLMNAVVGVLNESLTESIKAFYRLRKAYIALDAIMKMEEKFMEQRDIHKVLLPTAGDLSSSSSACPDMKSESASLSSKKSAKAATVDQTELNSSMNGLAISPGAKSPATSTGTSTPAKHIHHDPDSDIFKNEIDVFVHSGANFCFGIQLVLISMVPPAFSKLLSIIGFHGDKQRGLRMLWQASKFHNLIGAMAALALLGYYNGFVRYCDIMPDPTPGEADVEGYPQERLAVLLAEMRSRFPNSRLWILEESRMLGANKKLDSALELLSTDNKSPLKQVEGLCVFEKSLNALFLHKYDVCAEAFLECVELNSWSRSLYYYIAGSCHVALYRQSLHDPKLAAEHAKKATVYMRKAPEFAGKKRFMARQLPFDIFVTRKLAKLEARAKEWNVPFVDAIGVDPVEEMIFFWNGHSRMTNEQLEESLTRLEWCESENNKTWSREGIEEKAILELLRAAVLRSMFRHDEAKDILQTRVLNHDKALFKAHLKDDWVHPVAHFEMAANFWMERPTYQTLHGITTSKVLDEASVTSGETSLEAERKQVAECKKYLDHAARWETYELDARIGLKVTAAIEAVHKWESMHPTV
ncbi:Outer membrane protein IML2 mitochondrial/Tetratricopeptide repeat protein 39 [Penicillium cf. griseofulvum]|uniref:Inclusion body clearance protein IML2 n=1 Tax=Penicillium cf. griseofulvum TaxID=2972120 RepID=A0A9W9M116_9EURO|nr:Outer membrane protein IML2 mitochondrial/Tetratricopeptide repeat protein 39 [Penicillium cf. griseofulvum]KAJ5429493.1 Outer membrane protein IML2 mitochondrial/Tetratricopeptide repeat protein 39 [Penicillium cf. griseofulvum]KAJ5436726.1 Outer membrane protein IML2 mitochondrial/Tetratricopeptide repeat protein 39 [Penicillium cf. griseofulvum]